jgi:hypothetical protein
MKDVQARERLWGAGNEALIQRCPNGETQASNSLPHAEFIGMMGRTR